MIYDGEAIEPSGQILQGTWCFVLLILPIFGIRRYLYTRDGDNYRFLASAPVTASFATWNLCVLMTLLTIGAFAGIKSWKPDLFQSPPAPVATPTARVSGNEFMAKQAEEAFARKDWTAAVSYAEVCLQEPSNQRRALEILGASAIHLKNYKQAKGAYKKLLAIDPKNKGYRATLASLKANKNGGFMTRKSGWCC